MKKLVAILFVFFFAATPAMAVPNNVVQQIKAEAAQQFPGDYSTQLYVVNKQKSAYSELANGAFTGCEPILDEVISRVSQQFPGDYSTQFYVVNKDCAAYLQLQ